MDLIKHFTQSRIEPAPALPTQMHTATPQPQPLPAHLIEGTGNEPRIYSVRKMLENLPPDAIPANQSAVQSTASEPAAGSTADRNPGLAGAVLSYVEKDGGSEYQVFQAVARLFDQTQTARANLNNLGSMFDSIETL